MIIGGGQNPLVTFSHLEILLLDTDSNNSWYLRHGRSHVIAFQVVTANGHFMTVSEELNSDLFWGLRGGGGGTFGFVVSVIIRAHPKLNVVTAGWVLDASTNSVNAFWAGTKKFYDVFLDWADAGIYSFLIVGNTPAPFLNMMFLFAPNHTLDSYTKAVEPFFQYLEANNITLTSPHKSLAHDSFYSAYQAIWGANSFPISLDNSLPANFKERCNETFALIKEHISSGKHFLGYHKAPAKYDRIDNAVSPEWRECAMFLVILSNKSLYHSAPEALAIANKDLQGDILQPWRDITPVSEGGVA
jgi:hypothetical protein